MELNQNANENFPGDGFVSGSNISGGAGIPD